MALEAQQILVAGHDVVGLALLGAGQDGVVVRIAGGARWKT
jgi:hypothetical protein